LQTSAERGLTVTTPERLRRRQRIEGALLILVGLAMILQGYYFGIQDRDQRECLARNFQELSTALNVRSDLVARETDATRRIWSTYTRAAGYLEDNPTGELPPKKRAKLQTELVAALLNYQSEIKDITRERKENPVPPYPAGECL
jgi:hypothetical protein